MVNKYLNTNDLDCPLPFLKTKLTLADLKSGQILEVTATDPTSWEDFASYAKISGNELVHAEQNSGKFIYRIKKK